VGVRFSASVQTGPGNQPPSYTMGTGSFPGFKRPGRGVDYPPHLAPRLKKEYSYTPTPAPCPSWPVLGRTFYLYIYHHSNSYANTSLDLRCIRTLYRTYLPLSPDFLPLRRRHRCSIATATTTRSHSAQHHPVQFSIVSESMNARITD